MLAIAAALVLSSCRPVTNVPRSTPNMPQSPTVAAVTPGIVMVPRDKYLFVEWILAIPDDAAVAVCGFGMGVPATPAYDKTNDHVDVDIPGDTPDGTIGFVGMREDALDLGRETVSPVTAVPFVVDDNAQIVRVEADGSVIVELFGTTYQLGAGEDLTILREGVFWDCRTIVYYQFINHGWLGPDQITVN